MYGNWLLWWSFLRCRLCRTSISFPPQLFRPGFFRLPSIDWKARELCSLLEVRLMVHEMIDGTYRQTNLPNESPEYLAKREELRLAEIELLNTREKVTALRRGLPKRRDDSRLCAS